MGERLSRQSTQEVEGGGEGRKEGWKVNLICDSHTLARAVQCTIMWLSKFKFKLIKIIYSWMLRASDALATFQGLKWHKF